MRYVLSLAILGLSACTAATVQTPRDRDLAPLWSFEEHASELRQYSCPEGTAFKRAESLDIHVIEAERGTSNARSKSISGMTLAGAWHLKSETKEFGGLSGLDVLPSGSLLAVTDDGKFVWIGIDPETGTPDGIGSIAYLRDHEGDIFPNKRAADSEDLVFRDGLAFVSFEQDHRIAAYDLESCGAAARAAPVAALDKVIDGHVLENNRGAEALAFSDQGLVVGFEARHKGGSPIGRVRVDGSLGDLAQTDQPNLYLLTSMDKENEITASVFRAYDPVRGSRAILKIETDNQIIAEATLASPLPVDNFEGVAIGTHPDGETRIWLISDDNFRNDQRTLLLAFDLDQ